MSRLGGRLRALRERPLEQRHFRATVVLVAGLGLAAAGFAALGPSLGAFTATVSSQAEVGAGTLDLSVVAPTPASSPTSCSANAGNSFSATCAGADVTTTAAPGQFNAADWQAASSGTITPGNDSGFSFSLTPSSCSGSNTTVCGDTEVTVDELSAEPNVATPLPGYSYQSNTTSYSVFSVSCPSTTVCVAVGHSWGSSSNPDTDGVIVTSTDGGATWSPVTYITGPSAGTATTDLMSVSCPSATTCVVGGYQETSSAGSDTAISLEGTFASGTWTWTTPTTVSGIQYFLGVSCLTGTTDCVAVGNGPSSSSYPFLTSTTFNGGSSWSTPVTLNSASTDFLDNDLSCTGSTTSGTCVALWDAYNPTSSSVAEAYVGTWSSGSLTWDTTGTAFPTAGDLLNSVACPTSTSCVVVGQNAGTSPTAGVADTLSIASGAGTWGTPTSPSGTALLDSVACTSASDCVAVGSWNSSGSSYYDASTTTTDGGTTWSSADQFSDSGTANDADYYGLYAVSCGSPTACAAVGDLGSATSANSGQSWAGYQPLACVYGTAGTGTPASNVSQTCDFSSSDTLATFGAAGLQTLQPSTVAGSGVLIEVATQLASNASTSDEGATATVPLSFEVSS